MSRASVIRGFLTDAAVAIDTAEGEFDFAVEEADELAMTNVLDYLEAAESAIADARERVESYVVRHPNPDDYTPQRPGPFTFLDEPENVVMRDLEGHGNSADR